VTKNKKLNVLVISIEERNPENGRLFDYLGQKCNLDLLKLSRVQAKSFYNYIKFKNCDKYDRVLIDLPFRLIYQHAKKLRKIKRLVFYEEDSCQNYIKGSKWYGKFSKFYQSIPGARVLTTSSFVTSEFVKNGIDAIYIGKSFDESVIGNRGFNREIKFAFVGRVKNKVYKQRQLILDDISQFIPLKFLRAPPGAQYDLLLNKILYFISADCGLGEYMIKNFEALAAGCLLCVFRLPTEISLIGFKDMKNVILYSSSKELVEKIEIVENNPELKEAIVKNGVLLAKNYTFHDHSQRLVLALEVNISSLKVNSSVFQKLLNFIKV